MSYRTKGLSVPGLEDEAPSSCHPVGLVTGCPCFHSDLHLNAPQTMTPPKGALRVIVVALLDGERCVA